MGAHSSKYPASLVLNLRYQHVGQRLSHVCLVKKTSPKRRQQRGHGATPLLAGLTTTVNEKIFEVIKGVVWCTRKVERFKRFYQTSSCLATMRMEKSSQKYALKWWWKMVMNPRVGSSPQKQIQTICYGFEVQGFQGQNPIIKVWFTSFFQPKKTNHNFYGWSTYPLLKYPARKKRAGDCERALFSPCSHLSGIMDQNSHTCEGDMMKENNIRTSDWG